MLRIGIWVEGGCVVNMEKNIATGNVAKTTCDVINSNLSVYKTAFWVIIYDWKGLEQKFERFWKAYKLSFTLLPMLYP